MKNNIFFSCIIKKPLSDIRLTRYIGRHTDGGIHGLVDEWMGRWKDKHIECQRGRYYLKSFTCYSFSTPMIPLFQVLKRFVHKEISCMK